MAFAAGFVAHKCHHMDRRLGVRMGDASEEALASVPSSWLQVVSRGQLYVPSVWWMSVVQEFEVNFCQIMGSSADRKPGIIRRLTEVVCLKHPDLDKRVARKLACTRLHFRLKRLNSARNEARAQQRASRKVLHHARSSH